MRIALLYDQGAVSPKAPSDDLRLTLKAVRRVLAHRHQLVEVPAAPPLWELGNTLKRVKADVVFNLCEGLDGDPEGEVRVASLLELLGVPYTGNRPGALRLALDKWRAKERLAAEGVPVPRGWLMECPLTGDCPKVRFPAIVKPRREDASIGIDRHSVVRGRRGLMERVRLVNTRWRQAALVEKYIDGREYSVALLGGRVLAVSEIRFSLPPGHPRIVTYGAKWRPGSAEDRGTTPVCPAPLDPGERRRIESTARRAYAAIGCTAHARVDLRDCLVLEVNPNPDLSPDAGFARAARAAGMSYERVLEELIDGAHPPAGRR